MLVSKRQGRIAEPSELHFSLSLIQVHWPRGLKKGTELGAIKDDDIIDPTEENLRATWCGMEKVAEKGLAKAIGISNYTITQTELLLKNAKIVPAVNQGISYQLTASWSI